MTGLVGLDVAEVRHLGNDLRRQAETLTHLMSSINGLVDQLGQHWHGRDAEDFRGWWETKHRHALEQAIAAISGLGQSALNNADEQDQVSGGTSAAATAGSLGAFGDPGTLAKAALGVSGLLAGAAAPAWTTGRYTNAWNTLTHGLGPAFKYKQSPVLQVLAHSPLKHFANNPAMAGLGHVGDVIGAAEAGAKIGTALGTGDLVGAAEGGVDASALLLKASGNPVAYGVGVNLLIWKDVGEAATAVDWSHLSDIKNVSASGWRDAFAESLSLTGEKALKWF